MKNLEALKAILATPKQIVLTSHTNPDGDAIGSCLALYHFFAQQGHRVSAIVPNEMPEFLSWMPGFSKIFVYDQAALYCTSLVQSADLIFCLDYNGLSRVDQLGAAIAKSPAKRVLIDHHLFPEDMAEFVLWDTRASSTCELIHDFFALLGVVDQLPMDTLSSLYTGILTDTGGFSYATSPKLFRLAADLQERGIDSLGLHEAVFNSYSEKRLRLLAFCLHERLEIMAEAGVAVIGLSQEDHQQYLIRRGDVEGIVNYPLKIRDIQVSVLVSERKNEVKLSFRSKGDISVQKICSEQFHGGGHRNASGGTSDLSFAETLQKIRDLIPQYFGRTSNDS
jgi:phosphoesterase RecJ-like protein